MTRPPAVAALRLAIAAMGAVLYLGPTTAVAQKNFDQPPNMGRTQENGSRSSAPPAAPSPDDRNPRFTLINDSDQIIDNLNISPVSDNSWGDDLFGTLALPPHNRIIAGPVQDSGCMFDVRVVYHDRREEVLRRQNLCKLDELAFTGRNARTQKARSQSDD